MTIKILYTRYGLRDLQILFLIFIASLQIVLTSFYGWES